MSEETGALNGSGGPDTVFKQIQEPVWGQLRHGGIWRRRGLHRWNLTCLLRISSTLSAVTKLVSPPLGPAQVHEAQASSRNLNSS